MSLRCMLQRHLPRERAGKVCLVMSGGTEGGMAPHWVVFERAEGARAARPRWRSVARTPRRCRRNSSAAWRRSTWSRPGCARAMRDAGIDDRGRRPFRAGQVPAADRAARSREADGRGAKVATRDTLKSMGLSRAASALGIAVALGEIDRAHAERRRDRHRCIAVVGPRQLLGRDRADGPRDRGARHVARMVGTARHRSRGHDGRHRYRAGARRAARASGSPVNGQLPPTQRERLVAVLAKAEASHDGLLRGYRHTMLDDSDISPTRHARAFVCGALAGLVGHAEMYVSGGAEHQGPDGGGPVALIVDRACP